MPDADDLLEAEAAAMAAARARLAPLLSAVLRKVPGAADAAIVVTFQVRHMRQPVVISTNRTRFAADMAAYVDYVRAERGHDRGRR